MSSSKALSALAASLCLTAFSGMAMADANSTSGNLVTNGSMNFADASSMIPTSWTSMNTLLTVYSSLTAANIPLLNSASNPDGGTFANAFHDKGYDGDPAHAYNYNNNQGTQGLFQNISGLTVGHKYELSFSTGAHETTVMGNGFWQVQFNGQTVNGNQATPSIYDNRTCNGTSCTGSGGSVGSSWTNTTMSFTATSTSSKLQFAAFMPAANNGPQAYYLLLDGVVLKDVTAVPEPSTLLLSFSGLAAMGLLLRRRRVGSAD